jgi:hypothetical protein
MILDFFLQFTGATAGAADPMPNAATTVSNNIIDLHMTGIPVLANNQGARDMGIGDDPALKIVCWVSVAPSAGTSLQVNLQGATDNGSGAPNAFVTWWSSPVYAQATLVAGARLFDMDMPRPPAGVAIPRFLQLQYIGVGNLSTGSLKAWIALDREDYNYEGTGNAVRGGYPAGVTVAN